MPNKKFIILIFFSLILWFSPTPYGLDTKSWHLCTIFIFTILGIIFKPLPMGAIAIISTSLSIFTSTLSLNNALKGFSNGSIWLVLIAFFIARGFIKTNLGTRIAYYFVYLFGQTTLGLAYSITLTELILAPVIPSFTARTGGIIYPIVNSLAQTFKSKPNHSSSKELGAYLIQSCFQSSVILGSMFITAMAGNPLIIALIKKVEIEITWTQWALAALIPGVLSLLVIPFIIYKILDPNIKKTPNAKKLALEKLKELGNIKLKEIIMLCVFILLLVLWIFGSQFEISSIATAFLGLSILLVLNVLTWEDILHEESAWNTFIWFSTLLTLGNSLNDYGVISFFSQKILYLVSDMHWSLGLSFISCVYFYSHYFFASNIAHIGAMYSVLIFVLLELGAPPMLSALILAFISNLFGGLTHYGNGPAPILYGSGYVSLKSWWTVGLIISFVNIFIWGILGPIWWKILGYW